MAQTSIHYFSNYVLRSPAFPINTYKDLLENYSEEKLLKLIRNKYIMEALTIASPDLRASLDAWLFNPLQYTKEKKEAIALSLLKYIARISCRCTPFGIFAGCNVGTVSNESQIIISPRDAFKRHTQFDMHFWISMLQDFTTRKDVRPYLLFYPNNTIYTQGGFYRYIEYKYVNKKREHNISAIEKTELLSTLLLEAEKGITIFQMVELVANHESEKIEATEYIHKLIDFQLLVSELDGQITGNNEWERILNILNRIPSLKKEQGLLEKCKTQIDLLDKTIIPQDRIYEEIRKLINEMGCAYEDKFFLQTDLNTTTISNSISRSIIEKTKQALYFLNGIQKQQSSINQANFINAFSRRYESREMPLATVLDTETGIGYIQDSEMNDSHPLLDSFSFKKTNNYGYTENWTVNDFILEEKLQEAISNGKDEIILSENDFPDFKSEWKNCPSTFSVMIEVIRNQLSDRVVIDSSGGISAAKLLGRFCHVNPEIHSLTKEIIQKEQSYYPNTILAEIAHIPQSRTGNILRRPVLRPFEISYLSNSGVASEFQILVSDLMVSVKNNSIILRSKKLNKEVIPCLSNAHNYSSDGLPIYQFLCDLQSQNLKPIYGFNWGVLLQHYNFFPRVVYKDTILSKAKWLVLNEEVEGFQNSNGKIQMEKFELWKNKRKIPRFVNWVNSDNTLLLDLDKEIGIKLFLKSIKNFIKVTLEEFIFNNDTLIKDTSDDGYSNQIILSFFKE